ncbi:MAG: YqhA family protein [Acidobacteriota bacterium]|nr:YqhA family protein [Acidobacteriota bacterium]
MTGPAEERAERLRAASETVLGGARFAVGIPVVTLLVGALGAFVYGVAYFVDSIRSIVDHPFPIGRNIGLFVVLIDLFLVGVTLLIAAVGLFELFLAPEAPRRGRALLPAWLVIRDLNDLKARVISMIVLVSAVSFVDVVVDFRGGRDVLYLGTGVAVVILALTVFVRVGGKGEP